MKSFFTIVDTFTGGIGEYTEREKYVVKSVDDVSSFIEVVRDSIKDPRAQRAVIDSVTALYLAKPALARFIVMTLKGFLSRLGCTSILVSQVSLGKGSSADPAWSTQPTISYASVSTKWTTN